MKKRLVALTLVAAMALGMTACGSKSNNKTTTNDTSDTAVSTAVDWTSYDELVESIRTEADLAKRAERVLTLCIRQRICLWIHGVLFHFTTTMTSICSRIMSQTYTQQ